MKNFRIKSYAKINLALNIIGKSTHLHKIESLVAFIDLHDIISIKEIKSKKNNISFIGKFSKNIGKKNTVSKLVQILEQKKLLNKKYSIIIKKQIPQRAGLGGGSMNASNVLNFFIKKKIINTNKKEIDKICKLIGSDVILGLNSVNTVLTSRGITKHFRNCKKFYILVIKPNFGCSTKEIYSKVRKFDQSQFLKPRKKMFDLEYLGGLKNSLEPIVISKFPKLKKIKSQLESLDQMNFVRMTGSGSAFIVYFESKKNCDIAKKNFSRKYKNYWCITSKTI